jgi:hypothetical protein
MNAHNITFRAFFSGDELAEGRLLYGKILPDAAVDEEALESETEGGVFTKPLYVLKTVLSTQKEVGGFISNMLSGLSERDLAELRETVESRIDDECNLYLRFDKKEFSNGRFSLRAKDAVQVKIKIAAFPKKKINAVKTAREMLGLE